MNYDIGKNKIVIRKENMQQSKDKIAKQEQGDNKNAVTSTEEKQSSKRRNKKKKKHTPSVQEILRNERLINGLNPYEESRLLDLSKHYNINFRTVVCMYLAYQKKCKFYCDGLCIKNNKKMKCSLFGNECDNEKIWFYYKLRSANEKLDKKTKSLMKQIKMTQEPLISLVNKHSDDVIDADDNIIKIGIKDFVVRGNVFKCAHNKHKIEDVTATIDVDVDGEVENIKISAGYCPQCKIFFILDSTYQRLKRKGIILCRISDQKNYAVGSSYGEMNLAKESLLMQYGYSVSQTEGLSETRRQKILALIIDNKAMSKSEIISYLDFFIMQRENMSNMQIAVSKWWDDRDFVEEYKIGEYTQYGVKAIYRTKVGMPKKRHSRYTII